MPIYKHLPRIEHYTIDGNLYITENTPNTESVLIVAPALDGPTDQPVPIRRLGDIEAVYGPIAFNTEYVGPSGEVTGYSGNELIKAVRHVQAGGGTNIWVWRIGGRPSSGFFNMPAVLNVGATGNINIYSRYGGTVYNRAAGAVAFTSGVASGRVTLTQPISKGGTITIEWKDATSGRTIAEVIDLVNAHPQNGMVYLAVDTINGAAPARVLHGTSTVLAGGENGTIFDTLRDSRIPYYNQLTTADTGHFALMENYDHDVVYLAGIFLDDLVSTADSTVSVSQAFSNYLGKRTLDHPTLGVIGCRPLTDVVGDVRGKVQTHFNALTGASNGTRTPGNWTNAGYFMNLGFTYNDSALDQPIDSGAYLQVVAADALFNDTSIGAYIDTVAGVYAGTITAIEPYVAPTNVPVRGIAGIPYEFTKAQLNTLTGGVGRNDARNIKGSSAYVTLRKLDRYGILFTAGVTAAKRTSDYQRLQVIRIVNTVHRAIKEISFPFLGKPNDTAHKQGLKTSIKSFLDRFADAGALLGREGVGYQLEVLGADNPYAQALGEITIDLMLKPALEIQAIKIRVRVSQP